MIAVLQHRAGELIQDRYEVLSQLGSGAFGTVYKCRDRELEIEVAVKELHVLNDPAHNGDEREIALAQFRREAQHLSHLRHPNIVSGHYQPHNGTWLVCPVCGFSFRGTPTCPEHNAAPVVLRQRHYLVMEYLEGPNLDEAAEQAGGALSVPSTINYIRQVAQALKLIHGRGWVHRDIKPENIRVRSGSDEAVLLDFGIATETGAAGDFTTRIARHTSGGGTLGYAPESPQERRFPDARSDIYALGMTLYRLVSGRDPQEPDDLEAMRAHRPRNFNWAITPALDDLIYKAISLDPATRQQDASEFLRELDALSEKSSSTPAATDKPSAVDRVAVTPAPAVAITEPFVFRSGESAADVSQLVELVDRYPHEAKEYLYSGEFETWLARVGRSDLNQRARELRYKHTRNRDQGLEAFMQATGLVESPMLEVTPTHIAFGNMKPGSKKSLWVELRNSGRGHLFGLVRASHANLEVPREFDGNAVAIELKLNTSGMQRGSYSGDIVIDSSAGELHLPYSATIQGPTSVATAVTVIFWALLGMLGGQLMRTLPFTLLNLPNSWKWLSPTAELNWQVHVAFGLTTWAVLLMVAMAEALRRQSCFLLVTGGMFSFLIAAGCGAVASDVMTTVDGLLQPIMRSITHDWAAGGWMFCGGILGAAYGTIRRIADVFSPRILQVIFGWLVAVALMYGVLIYAETSLHGLPGR